MAADTACLVIGTKGSVRQWQSPQNFPAFMPAILISAVHYFVLKILEWHCVSLTPVIRRDNSLKYHLARRRFPFHGFPNGNRHTDRQQAPLPFYSTVP